MYVQQAIVVKSSHKLSGKGNEKYKITVNVDTKCRSCGNN